MKSVRIFLFFAFVGISLAQPKSDSSEEEDTGLDGSKNIPMKTFRKKVGEASSSSGGKFLKPSLSLRRKIEPLNKKEECKCRLGSGARIVGGMEAAAHSIPWQISLADENNKHYCGGSILNRDHIITAADCVNKIDVRNIRVRVGLHRLDDPDIKQKTYFAIQKIPQTYADQEKGLAILKLGNPIKFEIGKVEPACYNTNPAANLKRNLPLTRLMASGWGATEQLAKRWNGGEVKAAGNKEPTMSPVLKMAYFNQVPESIGIQGEYPYDSIHINSQNGDSICVGDFGGPLHYTVNGRTFIEGIGGFAEIKRDGRPLNEFFPYCTGPASYSKLAHKTHKEFLEKAVGDNYCPMEL